MCQVICVNDLGFVLGVELGLMLVQSSVTRRRRGCGNVGIPRLLRDFQVRWELWKSRGRTFPRVPPRVISTAKLFHGSCGEPAFCWLLTLVLGMECRGSGHFPSLAYPRRKNLEMALCQSPWPGHALWPQHGEVI